MPAEDPIRLPKTEIGPAAEMLARAFMNDPKMAHWIVDQSLREEIARHVLEFELRYGEKYGEVYATSPALEGVAIWLPDDHSQITFFRYLFTGGLRFHREVGKEVFDRSIAYGEFMDKQRDRLVKRPYWNLFVVGVDPQFQGQGFASRLVRPMLARFDREGLPCYLVSENEQNLPKYEHLGFKTLERATVPGLGYDNWAMLREAKR